MPEIRRPECICRSEGRPPCTLWDCNNARLSTRAGRVCNWPVITKRLQACYKMFVYRYCGFIEPNEGIKLVVTQNSFLFEQLNVRFWINIRNNVVEILKIPNANFGKRSRKMLNESRMELVLVAENHVVFHSTWRYFSMFWLITLILQSGRY